MAQPPIPPTAFADAWIQVDRTENPRFFVNLLDATSYVAVRPWLNSRTVVELDAPVSTYEALDVPLDAIDTPQATLDAMRDVGRVSLTVGKGRLGLEWLKGVGPL